MKYVSFLLFNCLLFGIESNCQSLIDCIGELGGFDTIRRGCQGMASVQDIDGNEYPVIQIGDQCWTAENLKTTKFSNGRLIPNIIDDQTWGALATPAWCNYNNNAFNDQIYGKLYNWYTVVDSQNVCPTGWHVPTDAEWTILIDYLGGESVAGRKMKATTGWQIPNRGATNQSGFTGLPGGYRHNNAGKFDSIGYSCHWWSSSQLDTVYAVNYQLDYYFGKVFTYYINQKVGNSVRCLRD